MAPSPYLSRKSLAAALDMSEEMVDRLVDEEGGRKRPERSRGGVPVSVRTLLGRVKDLITALREGVADGE